MARSTMLHLLLQRGIYAFSMCNCKFNQGFPCKCQVAFPMQDILDGLTTSWMMSSKINGSTFQMWKKGLQELQTWHICYHMLLQMPSSATSQIVRSRCFGGHHGLQTVTWQTPRLDPQKWGNKDMEDEKIGRLLLPDAPAGRDGARGIVYTTTILRKVQEYFVWFYVLLQLVVVSFCCRRTSVLNKNSSEGYDRLSGSLPGPFSVTWQCLATIKWIEQWKTLATFHYTGTNSRIHIHMYIYNIYIYTIYIYVFT